MPFRILVVDDEPFVRDMVVSLLAGLGGDYRVVGAAMHGQAALDFLSSSRVDFVITDLKMPVMDGICLIREARRRGCTAAFLVLSAYDEFHLVTEAFKVGARDYLLKSEVTKEELGETLRRLSGDPERRAGILARLLDGSRRTQGTEASPGTPGSKAARQPDLQPDSLPEGTGGEHPAWPEELGFGTETYRILVLRQFLSPSSRPRALPAQDHEPEEASGTLLRWISESLQKMDGPLAVCTSRGQRQAAILIAKASPTALFDDLAGVAATQGCEIAGGLSEASQDPQALRECYLQAMRLCSAWFFHGRGHLFRATAACSASTPQDRPAGILAGTAKGSGERAQYPSTSALRSLLSLRKPEELARRIPQFILGLAWPSVDEIPAIRGYFDTCHELLSSALESEPEEQHDELRSLLGDYGERLSREGCLGECNAWLRAALESYCGILQSRSRIVRRCLEIVHAEYAGDISLCQIARRLDVSESYLSRLFSRDMGCGFVAYLSKVRVEKARDLLRTTSLKVYEVAGRSGFSNVEHFSRTFKKILGHSPSDYR